MNAKTFHRAVAAGALGILLAGAAVAEAPCVMVRGETVLTQPAGPFTEWVGPVSLEIRGTTYSGQATVFIDPLLLGNSGPPNFEGLAFDWLTFDLGEAGTLSAWELAAFTPLNETFTKFRFEGIGRLGASYIATGVYGPAGTGMFAGATGIMHARGTYWRTFPTTPSSLDARFGGQICGIDWN